VTNTPARWYPAVLWSALLALGAVLVVSGLASLSWPYIHDSPLMLYAGWYLAQGGVPYRDLFDMNMPGTYFAMWALGSVLGWNPLGFRIFDLLSVATVALATFIWLRPFGRSAAVAASMLFPVWYLAAGPSTSLQREFLALVPLSLALAAAGSRWPVAVRFVATGLLAGAAALIKPQFLLFAIPAMIRLAWSIASPEQRARLAALMVAGVFAPFAVTFAFLAYRGGLDPFFDIASSYWPLYTHLTGEHRSIAGFERLQYLTRSTLSGMWNPWVPLAIVGVIAVIRERRPGLAWTIVAMLVAAALYPALSGQFWSYHWLPFQYMLLCASALNLAGDAPKGWTAVGALRATAGAAALILTGATAVIALIAASTGDPTSDVVRARARAEGVPREVAEFLRGHLRAGDRVQPLDWTGGAVHGMFDARALLATRFMYDFHFYHHVDAPYIARLRRQFLRQLAATRPRFVIQVFGGRPWPTGPGTTDDFPRLREVLDSEYRVVREGETYRILERIAPGAEKETPGDSDGSEAAPRDLEAQPR
jgi:hypothetical protein